LSKLDRRLSGLLGRSSLPADVLVRQSLESSCHVSPFPPTVIMFSHDWKERNGIEPPHEGTLSKIVMQLFDIFYPEDSKRYYTRYADPEIQKMVHEVNN
jgi:hypothetical protein